MNYFTLKAVTVNGVWYQFDISDVPTPISPEVFVLLRKPQSPLLRLDDIRRGDPELNLFEGDIVESNGEQFLICYERGFYAINCDYITRQLDTLTNFTVVGTVDDIDFPVPIQFKKTHLFKFEKTIFTILDIVGISNDKVVINSIAKEIPTEDIQQDCCLSVDKTKLYLGDKFRDGVVSLHRGKLCVDYSNNTFVPIQEVI